MDPSKPVEVRRTRSLAVEFGEDRQARIAELIDLTLLQLDELIDVWCDLKTLVSQRYLALGLSRNARPVPGPEGSPARSICLDLRR